MNMPTSITISNVTGSSPYDIYLSPINNSNLYYITQIESIDLPYTFIVPKLLQDYIEYCLQIEDADGCIITNFFTIT
jgi:hypothetical protein